MPEQEYRSPGQGDEFARLAQFAWGSTALMTPELIRARGTQRMRRRRIGRTALGAGTFAVVAGLGAGLALHGSGHGVAATASAAPKVGAPTTAVRFITLADFSGQNESEVLSTLQGDGFEHVALSYTASTTVAQNVVIAVLDSKGQSLDGKSVPPDTEVTLVVSNSPAN